MDESKTYFTGIPCKRGHISKRLISTRCCLECQKTANKEWRERNPGAMYAAVKSWRSENKEKVTDYYAKMYASDRGNIAVRISRGISKAIGAEKAGRHWEEMVGYSLDELKNHLERQFVKGMNWENKSKWHIDHIVPKHSFSLDSSESIKACWALSNLRPIWASENCKKRHSMLFLV